MCGVFREMIDPASLNPGARATKSPGWPNHVISIRLGRTTDYCKQHMVMASFSKYVAAAIISKDVIDRLSNCIYD